MRSLALALCLVSPAFASEDIADQYPGSALYSKPVEVIPGVWSAIGATAPPTYENAGHNNNLSFIETGAGVVVVNGGAAYALAKALHDEIRAVTDEPVVQLVLENAQGHAMLGASYWQELGVPILAHVDADAEIKAHGDSALVGMRRYNRDKAEGTFVPEVTETFEDRHVLSIGSRVIEVLHLGPAHGPGDTQVWLPLESLLITGDIAFHERLLPIFEDTDTDAWVETWDSKLEPLNATYVIPGHGHPTNMAQVREYTRDYLVFLRDLIRDHLDQGGDLASAYYVDQSIYDNLDTFEELATRNAGRVFSEMEWE